MYHSVNIFHARLQITTQNQMSGYGRKVFIVHQLGLAIRGPGCKVAMIRIAPHVDIAPYTICSFVAAMSSASESADNRAKAFFEPSGLQSLVKLLSSNFQY